MRGEIQSKINQTIDGVLIRILVFSITVNQVRKGLVGLVEQESHVRDDVLGDRILAVSTFGLGARGCVQFRTLFGRVLETGVIADAVGRGSDGLLDEIFHGAAGVGTAFFVDHRVHALLPTIV